MLSVADLEAWESKYGAIPDDAVLIMRTGYGQYYAKNKTAYLGWPPGMEETNPRDTEHLHFPGLDPVAAKWIVNNRKVTESLQYTSSLPHGGEQTLLIGWCHIAPIIKLKFKTA